ncbi:MAG: YdcF family protein [Methyloprofundus sp.]|nr:YdcF family protein [Methyloprofundus sp.]
MSLLVIFASIFCTTLFHFLRWNKAKNTLLVFIVLIVILIGTGIAPGYLLDKLQESYADRTKVNWLTYNVIVLLGAGTQKLTRGIEPTLFSYARISETVRLYNDCAQNATDCHIIVSGGDASKQGESEAEVYKRYLLDLGIVATDIIEESKSMNTWQNAQFTSDIIKTKSYDSIILVTSGLHLQRSEAYFSYFGINTIPVRADYMSAKLSMIPLWYNFAVMDFAIHEWLGFYRYNFYNHMGWNPKRFNPGEA